MEYRLCHSKPRTSVHPCVGSHKKDMCARVGVECPRNAHRHAFVAFDRFQDGLQTACLRHRGKTGVPKCIGPLSKLTSRSANPRILTSGQAKDVEWTQLVGQPCHLFLGLIHVLERFYDGDQPVKPYHTRNSLRTCPSSML